MMPEWLTKDPLNGLVITFFFFISLIIGRYFKEHLAKSDKRGRIAAPWIKLILAFLLIIAITLMKHWYIPAAISIICIIIAQRLNMFRNYGKYMIFPLLMAVFILIVQGFTEITSMIGSGFIQIKYNGLDYGFLIFSRIFASASVLILFILTTSEFELHESMRWLRIPATILDISSFMSRYIKTFSTEGTKLRLAQESRLGSSGNFLKKIKYVSMIFSILIIRAFSRGEEVCKAMLSRGWKPGSGCSETPPPIQRSDIFSIILIISGLAVIVFLDWFI